MCSCRSPLALSRSGTSPSHRPRLSWAIGAPYSRRRRHHHHHHQMSLMARTNPVLSPAPARLACTPPGRLARLSPRDPNAFVLVSRRRHGRSSALTHSFGRSPLEHSPASLVAAYLAGTPSQAASAATAAIGRAEDAGLAGPDAHSVDRMGGETLEHEHSRHPSACPSVPPAPAAAEVSSLPPAVVALSRPPSVPPLIRSKHPARSPSLNPLACSS
jgi:hypothetical protein